MYKRHEIGIKGEEIATAFLEKKGYEIIERNFKAKIGEIDIIAKDKEELVFVEVKTRSQSMFGRPGEAVDDKKQKHIYRTAEVYLMLNDLEDAFCRIDVIEIFFYSNTYKINHIENAVLERPKSDYYKNDYDEEFIGFDETQD